MRIFLTGKNGQLGRCLQDVCLASKHDLISYGSDDLDISQTDQVLSVVTEVKPDIIVNAAAYTAVDKAEDEPDKAYAVNELGVENLAQAAQQLGIPVIHVSTDYVFDGDSVEPYKPSDPTAPQGVYGASKLAGEKRLAQVCTQYIVLRTAWVFSEYGNNFVKTMVRLANQRDSLSVVADQYGCPTYAGDLAQAILQLCDQYQQTGELAWGMHHYCGDLPTSWHGFARTIFAKAEQFGLIQTPPQLTAISSAQYPTSAKRPEYSVLDMATLTNLGVSGCHWLSALDKTLEILKKEVQ
ncbi:dTDP-4-dehydrorhamnose reductase [Marinomonas atlantica]|uniref:dTDP-4-dehydrorhamnose reductase n=1 Tax=Marinomonas atlantica TaxID=1806668 RepID=UPI000833640F|nr:dTDP-4-dehydrorhamnose reductase [Marinomonas atlantica]MCO4785265.1 dTDP-4-dehydrorhamnose reductase [Marinomonas atlantica]